MVSERTFTTYYQLLGIGTLEVIKHKKKRQLYHSV